MQMPVHIVAAGGFVTNEKDEILLVKTRRDGHWVFPGGQIEVGENLIDGVIREVKEESGLDVTVSHLVGVFSNTATYEGHSGVKIVPTKVMFDFVCEPVGGEFNTSDETSDVRWVRKEDVLNMISAPALRTRYQAYLNFEGSVQYMDYVTKPEFEVKSKRTI
ncbi:NUDIX hydrolase [Rossellomorea marisflavi]|uniref:NUDIX hydrolase n=1 Tax=Rossellomorea marisflavi TaxID=189381 RepID=A0A5D4RYP2_9BACI|nr:NUDIX hydrolase [Rossellomorea marisflavi]KQU59855.1 ADP-ribose pyrophosphatase [Bacillus sp. Leaf406]TYS56515.1 NUDIX hydrolase [Rossellomorea marisflavi]